MQLRRHYDSNWKKPARNHVCKTPSHWLMIITGTAFVSLKSIINISSCLAQQPVLILQPIVPARGVRSSRLSCLWIQAVERGRFGLPDVLQQGGNRTVFKIQATCQHPWCGGHHGVLLWAGCSREGCAMSSDGLVDFQLRSYSKQEENRASQVVLTVWSTLQFRHFVALIYHTSLYNGSGERVKD